MAQVANIARQPYTAGLWPQTQAVANTSVWPYSANVVWQDTSSNATYCSAVSALQR